LKNQRLPTIGLEQMYTPHQIPWTIGGAERLLRKVFVGNVPFYLSLDTGHQVGQRRFGRPTEEVILRRAEEFRATGRTPGMWLGTARAHEMFRRFAVDGGDAKMQAGMAGLEAEMDAHPYLFAMEEDGDLYAWARRVGRYCPIVHLQQTDGKRSVHWPFTDEFNARGIVDPAKLLRALAASFAAEPDAGNYPPACERVCLTLEIFSATMDMPEDILSRLAGSVAYWRRFVPRDGLALDELAAACGA